ncbi:uncharacterized protein EI90DRAFT_3073417 [Cantharellus anzutake]|uniref:uncharacterized protein n=1 Tax=Cantharellus anzutake TaxID=1750568 RepID=UPI0019046800|nr:uncharacterized protein EI90DRAFT_3073417 [Cantharellus anzutake]KAF8325216.1 hypothetical protein EI90DRAFT_3073417 [Cantharellus anzutake]
MSFLARRAAACMALSCRNWLYASRERLYRLTSWNSTDELGTGELLDRTLNGSAEIRDLIRFLCIYSHSSFRVVRRSRPLPHWLTLLPASNVQHVKLQLSSTQWTSYVLSLPFISRIHTLSLKFKYEMEGNEVERFVNLPNLRRLWVTFEFIPRYGPLDLHLHPPLSHIGHLEVSSGALGYRDICLLQSFGADANVVRLSLEYYVLDIDQLFNFALILKSEFRALRHFSIKVFQALPYPIIDDILPCLPQLAFLSCGGNLYREGVLPNNLSEFHLYTDEYEIPGNVLRQLESSQEHGSPSSPGLSLRKFGVSGLAVVEEERVWELRDRCTELGVEFIHNRSGPDPISSWDDLENDWFPEC